MTEAAIDKPDMLYMLDTLFNSVRVFCRGTGSAWNAGYNDIIVLAR